MQETLATESQLQEPVLPEVSVATDADILAYLHRSHKIAHIAALAEQDALILNFCEKLNVTVSDEEWQAAGDAFRLEHKLLGATETLTWLAQQRISAEDWSEGIKVALLTKKLKEHLFGDVVDNHYISNRDNYQRVALSQILVSELSEALQISRLLTEANASFCALALEYSKGKQSKESGGFMGIRFLPELMPEIVQAITDVKEGEIVAPIQTQVGYHVIKVEKWFPVEFSEMVRETILELFFQTWLQEASNQEKHSGLS
jgi:parvulin-like peptidyl-prolyl isomerase